MRLFDSDIKKLRMLSTANFKKQTCSTCGDDFYSFRDCLYCDQACKQMAYRKRMLSSDTNEINTIPAEIAKELLEQKPLNQTKTCFDDGELDEKLKKYTNNLKQLKYGR